MAADPALVVSLEARLNKFEKQLKEAGKIADREVSGIEDRFSRLNPGLAVGVGSFLGSIGGSAISEAISQLGKLYDRFKEIDETAKLAAISMNSVFGFQSSFKGSSFEEVDKALVALSGLLDRAKRGEENNLSTILNVNGTTVSSIKDAGEALFKIADIVSRLPAIQGLEVLQKLGLPANLLTDLQKGEEHLREMQRAAADAAPDLQALAEKAKEFDVLWKAATEKVKAYFVGMLDELRVVIAQFLEDTARELRALESLSDGIRSAFGITGKQGLAGQGAEGLEAAAAALRGAGSENGPRKVFIRGGGSGANPFPIENDAGGEDSFERAVAQMEKRIAILNAETGAIGQNSEARERAKTVAALEESAKRANSQAGLENTAVTEAQRAKINEVADAMLNAASASRQAQEQFQKINAASAQFGSALSTAFADAVVEGKNLNEVFGSLIKTLEKAAINSVFASIFNAPSGGGYSPFLKLFGIGANAEGTDNWRGGLSLVGERGPELVNLPRGAQVIPNDVLRSGGGGGSISNVFHVAGEVSQATVDRLQRMIIQTQRAVGQTNKAMGSAQRFQMTGVG